MTKKTSTARETLALFPIVGIGASAGGLDAFTQLLAHLPIDSGMAFVLIQHLDPTHKSFLGEALAKATAMPISQPTHGERAQANHVYVSPPKADVSIEHGLFALLPRVVDAPRPHLPIDFFFAALAADRGSQAIGVVLSGMASDGTEGLRAIKAEGGITFVQDPKTARFAGMPSSAIDAGVVDYTLPIADLAMELIRLSRHPYVAPVENEEPLAGDTNALANIMDIVRTVVGIDYREYKSPTFERRLARRMALRRIDTREVYFDLLEHDAEEVHALSEDALIHVSSFFRDPEVFESLKTAVFPEIVKHKEDGAAIRVWVAGCSTGEELYSLALSLIEFLGDSPHPHPVQLFGSDASEKAIKAARAGRYSEGAMRGVSEERRRRYFTKTDSGFQINKSVRDLCVFVRHDLARDPPFSKLDLLSCRNVLIYFDQPLQKRVIPTFHYSLNQPGFLLLGRSEHVAGFSQLFSPVDKASKIFARSATESALRFAPRTEMHPAQARTLSASTSGAPLRRSDISKQVDNLLLAHYSPPGVLVNAKLEVIQFRGETGSYLRPAPGEPQNNLVKMARGGLLARLRAVLERAAKELAPVREEGVEVDQDGFTRTCTLVVIPFTGVPNVKEQLFLVLFEKPPSEERARVFNAPRAAPFEAGTIEAQRIPMLEHELSSTTQFLRSLIDEQSRTNEDLGSANEELVSGNEELQSLNEELETAKEELQSTNEELLTVNDELHHRSLEVGQVNSDLVNLLSTVDVPIVILDRARHIRRFTPQAQAIFNILPTDVGRLFDNIKPKIDIPDLDRHIREVIDSFEAKELEVQDRAKHWYRLQIRPYKTANEAIDGAIVSLFDIDVLKNHVSAAQDAKALAERADQSKDEFLATVSHELRTPLSALLMQTHLLREAGADTAKRDRACDRIDRAARMQVQLIDDLIDVSRIVTGKLRVDLQPVNLRAVVEVAVENVHASAVSKSIQLTTFLDSALPSVCGDRMRLEQIVSNLLVNAIKFTPSGGKIEVSLEREGEQAHLQVSDNGMGIEPSFLPRIFNRLTQADSSSTRSHSGLGLGLAIVHHLIIAHEGTVRAESRGAGLGATFHITVPLVAELPKSVTTLKNVLRGCRILILEDDAELREGLAEMLTDVGATVRTAESAAIAFPALQEFHPDILICDIAMPVEDGYSFIRRVRALAATSGGDTPALALTALISDFDRHKAMAEGFQLHLPKPIDFDRVTKAVSQLLQRGAERLQ